MSENSNPQEPQVLLHAASPYGNLHAAVQADERTVYLYLYDDPELAQQRFGTRACWVCNLIEGPLVMDLEPGEYDAPPVLPRTVTKHREGQSIPDNLEIVWFEEGNGIALIQRTAPDDFEILTVIPPWSGENGLMGYAAQCAVENQLCGPLPETEALRMRIEDSAAFWASFRTDQNDAQSTPFAQAQAAQLPAYQAFAKAYNTSFDQSGYCSINHNAFPPRGLVEFTVGDQDAPDELLAFTVGVSIVPQPNVELAVEYPRSLRRIELACWLNQTNAPKINAKQLEQLRAVFSGIARAPWQNFIWFQSGQGCSFPGVIEGSSDALLIDDRTRLKIENELGFESIEPVKLHEFRGDPVNLIWLVPVTDQQMKSVQAGEESPYQVAKRLWPRSS